MFVRALLFVALTSSVAFAGDTVKKPKVAFRVVKIMPESHQALLFDKTKGTHVLAEVGGKVGELTVEDIDDDEVTLQADGGAEIVLAAPNEGKKRHKHDKHAETKPSDKPASDKLASDKPVADATPVDPYAAAGDKTAEQPVDPYADPAVRTVEAPAVIDAGAPATPTASAPAPTSASAPSTTPTPAAASPIVFTRGQITTALADFGKLATGIRGAFTKEGVRVDAIGEGSLFARAGLVAGDTITSVNDLALASIDDAATLYARASTAKAFKVQLTRAGKPLTIRIAIQ